MEKLPIFDARDWHWLVGDDTSRLWSSATRAYVPFDPTEYFSECPSEELLREYFAAVGMSDRAPAE